MTELLFPTTDGGVVVQLFVTTLAFGLIVWLVRRHIEWRVFSIGMYVLALAFFGLRTLH